MTDNEIVKIYENVRYNTSTIFIEYYLSINADYLADILNKKYSSIIKASVPKKKMDNRLRIYFKNDNKQEVENILKCTLPYKELYKLKERKVTKTY